MNTEIPENPSMERNGKASSRLFLRVVLALVLFGIPILAALAAVGVVCFFIPRQYYSRVFMEVNEGEHIRVTPQDGPRSNWQVSLVHILQSKGILYPVIDNLKLVDVWSAQDGGSILPKEEVYRMLRERMVVTAVRNTDLVEIGVFSTDRVEAANIANMTAVIYLKVRQDNQEQVREATLAQLREQMVPQQNGVRRIQEQMRKFQEKAQIVDPNPEDINARVSGSTAMQLNEYQSEAYLKTKADYLNAKRVLEAFEKRLASESVDVKLQTDRVKIWEKAEPAIYPAKPNVNEMMLHAASVGSFLGLILSGIYLFRTRRPHNPC